jgi:hypothetical protein
MDDSSLVLRWPTLVGPVDGASLYRWTTGCPPIEASCIDRIHQSRSPEDEGRVIPRKLVVYK